MIPMHDDGEQTALSHWGSGSVTIEAREPTVFLSEPPYSPYDLRFRLLGTDVRVHPLFWLVAVIFGWPNSAGPDALRDVLIWVVCVFVSILVHEFGHVLMGRVFGSWGYIVLYSFGGLAVGSNHLRRWWQRVLVAAAGPGAGFLLFAVVVAGLLIATRDTAGLLFNADLPGIGSLSLWSRLMALPYLVELNDALREIFSDLIWINLFWGLVNLLPVWPLDGGMISREICERCSPNGRRLSLGISIGAAALFAVHSLTGHFGKPLIPYLPDGGLFVALFFAAMAYGSYLELQATPPSRGSRGRRRDGDQWSRPSDSWRG
jgi:stage IV sporulation protein FB